MDVGVPSECVGHTSCRIVAAGLLGETKLNVARTQDDFPVPRGRPAPFSLLTNRRIQRMKAKRDSAPLKDLEGLGQLAARLAEHGVRKVMVEE